MGVEAERLADDAAERYELKKENAGKSATPNQYDALHNLLNQYPLTRGEASELIDDLIKKVNRSK